MYLTRVLLSIVLAWWISPPGALAEEMVVQRVEPPNWWTGMQHRQLQLMIYGRGLQNVAACFADDAIQVEGVHHVASGGYAFVDVELPARLTAGTYRLSLRSGTEIESVDFPVLARMHSRRRQQGFGPQDVIYLITPDRFANGNPDNDHVEGLLHDFNPADPGMRHGGDLQGIIDHLDYLRDLGITAIWLNPVLENNGRSSYHGYAATNLYRIDPRLGTNDTYRQLVEEAHRRDIKVIFDHVSNHVGIRHPWLQSLPADDWLNGSQENHLRQKHYLLSITDPHADAKSVRMLKSFWFVDSMPDLNQQNPQLAKYLIQNTLWWIEFSGLDGIREDTYPYADQQFLADWAQAIRAEYPRFNIVGEIWSIQPSYVAHFQEKSILPRDFETNLPAVMDFPLMDAFRRFVAGDGKLRDIHGVYAQDFLYTDTSNLVVFVDNHDVSRAIFHANGDDRRVRLALTILMTARGIPQILYGTELNLLGGSSHVELRVDFPGGFPSHTHSAFLAEERTENEQSMYTFMQTLLRLRPKHPALWSGRMLHVPPTWNRDVYTYLKIHDDETLLVIANAEDEAQGVELDELRHHLPDRFHLKELLPGNTGNRAAGAIQVPPLHAVIYQVVEEEETGR